MSRPSHPPDDAPQPAAAGGGRPFGRPARRLRNRALQPLGDGTLLGRVFNGNPTARMVLLRSVWPRIVGPDIARRTRVQALSGEQLQVRVTDARWMRVLHRMQARLVSDLQRAVGTLAPRRLGFIEGHVESPPAEPPINVPASPPHAIPPASVAAAAAAIGDAETRKAFLRSAALYLARFER